MSPEELARTVSGYADDKKARDIVELDLRGVVGYTDFFVICSGTTERQTKAIEAAFSVADRAAAKFPSEPTIGEIAVACAIGYLDLRVPEDGWRDRYPSLARWLDKFSQRPSLQATRPPPG